MPYIVTTPAADYPVSVQSLKDHLRITDATEDTLLAGYLAAATAWVEDYTRRALITRTVTLTLDAFPTSGVIELSYPPVSAVTSVKYYDTNNAQQTLASSKYWTALGEIDGAGSIILKSTESWPDLHEDRPRAVEVVYVCGYGATADVSVPAEIRTAVLLVAATLAENRVMEISGTIVSQFKFSAEALLGPRRFYSFG